jgi:hypothetical protein
MTSIVRNLLTAAALTGSALGLGNHAKACATQCTPTPPPVCFNLEAPLTQQEKDNFHLVQNSKLAIALNNSDLDKNGSIGGKAEFNALEKNIGKKVADEAQGKAEYFNRFFEKNVDTQYSISKAIPFAFSNDNLKAQINTLTEKQGMAWLNAAAELFKKSCTVPVETTPPAPIVSIDPPSVEKPPVPSPTVSIVGPAPTPSAPTNNTTLTGGNNAADSNSHSASNSNAQGGNATNGNITGGNNTNIFSPTITLPEIKIPQAPQIINFNGVDCNDPTIMSTVTNLIKAGNSVNLNCATLSTPQKVEVLLKLEQANPNIKVSENNGVYTLTLPGQQVNLEQEAAKVTLPKPQNPINVNIPGAVVTGTVGETTVDIKPADNQQVNVAGNTVTGQVGKTNVAIKPADNQTANIAGNNVTGQVGPTTVNIKPADNQNVTILGGNITIDISQMLQINLETDLQAQAAIKTLPGEVCLTLLRKVLDDFFKTTLKDDTKFYVPSLSIIAGNIDQGLSNGDIKTQYPEKYKAVSKALYSVALIIQAENEEKKKAGKPTDSSITRGELLNRLKGKYVEWKVQIDGQTYNWRLIGTENWKPENSAALTPKK